MGSAFLIVVLALVVIVLVLLLSPVRIRFRIAPGDGRYEIRYLLLTVRRDLAHTAEDISVGPLRVLRRRIIPGSRKPEVKEPADEKGGTHTRPDARARVRAGWMYRGVLRHTVLVIARLVGRILRSLRLETGRVELEVGFGDPARMGMAMGFFHAIRPALPFRDPCWRISVKPDYYRSKFIMQGDLRLRIIPVTPLYHLLRALGTLPWRGLWKFKNAWTS